MCNLLCGLIRERELELDVHVVEDSGEDRISHDGNRDGDWQGPGF